jgi:hypothetical protein
MKKSEDIYWQQWQKLIEGAANFQELLTGSVMIGGSAVAFHLKHRYSFDADHILFDLKEFSLLLIPGNLSEKSAKKSLWN